MADYGITRLIQRGRIYVWKYTSSRASVSGWHTTADREGCGFMIELLKFMLNSKYSTRYIIDINEADSSISSVHREPFVPAKSFEIIYPKGKVEGNYWHFEEGGMKVRLTLGEGKLRLLLEGYEGILDGRGDFSLGPDDEDNSDSIFLWFWWNFSDKNIRKKI